MEYDSLSQNGIHKLINNLPVVVQIVQIQKKTTAEDNNKFIIIQVSDGFAKMKRCVILQQPDQDLGLKIFDILRIEVSQSNMKNGKVSNIMIQVFKVLRDDLTGLIGAPIPWIQYQKNKSNPKGDNIIPPKKKNINKPNLNKQPTQIQSTQSINHSVHNQQTNNQSNKPGNNPQQQNKNNTNQSNQPNRNQMQGNNNRQSNQNTNSISNPPTRTNQTNNQPNKQPNKPGNNQQTSRPNQQNKPAQSRHDKNYMEIRQLYEGMEDWKLKVRVIFRTQVKSYIKKANGQESFVFSFQACDRGDSIQFSVFGQAAHNISSGVQIDKVYQITGGKVSNDDQKHKLKIMLNQRSIVNQIDDDLTLPMVDDFCITPQQLMEKDPHTQWNVIALIKDVNDVVQFVSKNGKNCKKKQIYLCDPEANLQVPVTLWFQKADIPFEKIPYALQGITVATYNEQKQFGTSLRFNFRPYRLHNFRKFVTTYETMKLQNPIQQFSNRPKPNYQIINFSMLKKKADELETNHSIVMQKVCYLTQISLTNKNYYLSCPYCRRKVMDEQNGSCTADKCGKAYQRGKYRYLLNVSLADQTDTIWATAYDEAAQIIMTSQIDNSVMTADEYAKTDENDLRLRMSQYLDREMKVTITAKKQTYNGTERVKFGISKAVINLDYGAESAFLDKQIDYLKNCLGKN